MQALAGLLGELGKVFKSDGGVNQITQDEPCRYRLTAQKQSCRFIEKRLGKLGITRYALDDGLLEAAR